MFGESKFLTKFQRAMDDARRSLGNGSSQSSVVFMDLLRFTAYICYIVTDDIWGLERGRIGGSRVSLPHLIYPKAVSRNILKVHMPAILAFLRLNTRNNTTQFLNPLLSLQSSVNNT